MNNQEMIQIDALERLRKAAMIAANRHLNTIEKNKRENFFECDDQIIRIKNRRTAVRKKLEIGNMFLANYDKYIQALSRELTRKTSEESRSMSYASSR